MKKVYIVLIALLMANIAICQVPQKMSFQSVVRNALNQLLANQQIGIQVSILHGSVTGTAVYIETQSTTSNENGLLTIEIGGGTPVTGTFAGIDWSNGPYYLKADIDPTGGTNYSITSTSQLLSVPYALYANMAGKLSNSGVSVFPTVLTAPVTHISSNGMTYAYSISNANSNQIIERGIVYSTSPNPTITSIKVNEGAGSGSFASTTIYGLDSQYQLNPNILTPNTTYYLRAYAITENNITSYGNEVSFKTLPVGQTGTGGGLVFFDKGEVSDGWRYLEAAPSDQSTGIEWGCKGTLTGASGTEIGTGKANTALIVSICTDGNYAAKICDDLSSGGQTDWFLPSVFELSMAFINGILMQPEPYYWSSSEFLFDKAWSFAFNGGYTKDDKNIVYHVRAIRAF